MTQNISHKSWVILSIGVTEQDRKGAGSSSSSLLISLKKSLSTKQTVKTFGYRSTSLALGQFSLELIINHRNTTSSNKSLAMVKQTNSQICLLRDFNLPKVNWELMAPKPDCSHPTFYRECLEVFNDCLLEQMVTSPTWGQNILDLLLTSNPTLIEKVSVLPGLSDHDIVMA